ncbi:MAG TPA: hypothetical protein VFY38_13390, partial [Pseudonocardia sp.]|nr:hypothetical protein [Pseudonocardia sp.]
TAALFAGLLRYGVARRPAAFGAVAGLTVLARPDVVVVVVVVFLVLRPGWARAIGAALAVMLPWYVFSWLVLGSALPDTLVMKIGDAWSSYGFWNGPLLYLAVYPAATVLAFVPVVVGVPVLAGLLVVRLRGRWVAWQRAAAAAGLAAVAHYGAYCLLHTAPYHWYYAPLVVGMTLCASIVVARLRPVVAVPAALACASLAFDLAQGIPWDRAPISTNWATAAQYQRMGEDLHRVVGAGAVESPGEIGTLAYYCDCAIVDAFSDRGRVIGAIEARERAGGLGAALLRLNYAHLDRAQQPLPVDFRLRYEARTPPAGPDQWPVDHWVDGPGRIVLVPGR